MYYYSFQNVKLWNQQSVKKDAHLALLEISGIRSARQADEVDRLRMDKRRLVENLKKEVRL
ncbi:hypothetical protein NQ317_018925 [Molorchus minor]|uniref:Uncharacterized protein n=1 Tax=Molorchus minor TaxID=1323400 RepID=A0ABQ9JAY0_9CUCU|nr:hypothetical protein NQ317_018925 [Molorchus minor]